MPEVAHGPRRGELCVPTRHEVEQRNGQAPEGQESAKLRCTAGRQAGSPAACHRLHGVTELDEELDEGIGLHVFRAFARQVRRGHQVHKQLVIALVG